MNLNDKNLNNNELLAKSYVDAMQTQEGTLQFGVFAVSVGKPVSDATISIFSTDSDGNETQVEEIKSDSSGQSAPVTLAAPPKEYSFNPELPKPYSEYTARIRANGFETLEIRGIQIFSQTNALQDARLNPTMVAGSGIRSQEMQPMAQIDIKDHTLWGEYPPKIPEDEEKPLNSETGFVVLDKPVIPQTIVVHDGGPNNTAGKNYYIPFKDYIKNVASSEIYATWPDATIRANILAILSFTLNRVFTEWYRAKGKNFTITSSTAYDHAFFYGRNIYKEISQIVDETFTTYITRPGIRQPLLTQYCDGRQVSCPNWMTQWGSKDLGQQGYSAINILKYYYGSNIYLTQAVKVSGIPSSFPGTNLQQGSTGADVRTIQTQLNAISNNFPAIPKVRVDGVYGPATTAAVKKFQQVFNMPQTGIVDYQTWYRISDIYVAVTKMAELVK